MTTSASTIFRKHLALPQQHGAWVMWLGPYLVGIGVGGTWAIGLLWLTLASVGGFLLLQPLTIYIKILSKRRPVEELKPALFWLTIYALLSFIGLVGLGLTGYVFIAWLTLPALPVLIWQLFLVARREERGQMGVEIVGAGVLALAAPAAYGIAVNGLTVNGWLLWLLCWAQAAGAIVYVYLRLEQRRLTAQPTYDLRWQMARRALLYNIFNLLGALILAWLNYIPPLVPLTFAIMLLEVVYGSLIKPGVNAKPIHLGFRQAALTIVFTFLLIWTYRF